jgi:hypothetical protein
MITTLDKLKEHLSAHIEGITHMKGNSWPESLNVESVCAHIWKDFTPHALTFWTTSGVLNHIAECLDPPAEDEGGADDE